MSLVPSLYAWKPFLEILILWLVIYHIMLFFEGTRARQVMRGIVMLVVAFFVFQKLELTILDWLLTKLFGISVIAILIIFHPEIRQGLAILGQRHLFTQSMQKGEIERMLREIIRAAENLCKNKEGALIVIEKSDPLAAYIETGIALDSRLSSELIETIFNHHGILHDGGLIIQHGRISAAGCLFPLDNNPDLSRVFGTRHRAALGLSQETDAVIIVVSEERQNISLVYRQRLYRDMATDALTAKIKEIIKLKNDA